MNICILYCISQFLYVHSQFPLLYLSIVWCQLYSPFKINIDNVIVNSSYFFLLSRLACPNWSPINCYWQCPFESKLCELSEIVNLLAKFSCAINHAWRYLLWLTILILMVFPSSLKIYMLACLFPTSQVIHDQFLASHEWSPKVVPQQPVFRLGFCESWPYLRVSLFRQDTHCLWSAAQNVGIMTSKHSVAL